MLEGHRPSARGRDRAGHPTALGCACGGLDRRVRARRRRVRPASGDRPWDVQDAADHLPVLDPRFV